jgi:prepilin-type N-terminal cleavage/methylation domain-containing protein
MKGAKGFSLIELLVIIAIAGTLSGIAILSAPGMMDTYRVRGATRTIYGDMQMTRLRALKEGKEFAVEFVTGNTTTYCVKRKATGAANWDAGCNIGAADTADEVIKTVFLGNDYSGITLNPANLTDINETANERAAFDPKGTASGGSMTISKGVKTQTITINTNTANMRVS